ncbi:MAG TPA: NAD(P)H-hydrate dehydratase [Phycisphaerae bacterium]|nr:NAD(P)H-hydrate dehydratase [Phycisphaerae bacterium]HNU46105.1 NAD(P)H-hydrate dehydratase [Phycisphaerae bacterium]
MVHPGKLKPVITREISSLPQRADDAHKGNVGRLVIIGGCVNPTGAMIGAPALAANAAFRTGAGLVQLVVPPAIQNAVAVLAWCATLRSLPPRGRGLGRLVEEFQADAVAVGPGLGGSISSGALLELLHAFRGPVVLDAEALNLLATLPTPELPDAQRLILTPHPGEARRLLAGRPAAADAGTDDSPKQRQRTALALVATYGCTVVLKGHGTVVTNGQRLYVNETGNSGMATGGAGDVLTGVIAALLGQKMEPLEAAILGVHLHGLAGDFAAEELGRASMTAADLVEFLPDAFFDHEALEEGPG